jgi:hypothetical protein
MIWRQRGMHKLFCFTHAKAYHQVLDGLFSTEVKETTSVNASSSKANVRQASAASNATPDARMISQDASLFQYRVKNEIYQVVDANPHSPQTGVFLLVLRPKIPSRAL